MKKPLASVFTIFLCVSLPLLAGCKGNSGARVKANEKVIAMVKTWGSDISFYTAKKNPLNSIEDLKQEEIACWGPELADKIRAFYEAAGTKKIYGTAVQVISPASPFFEMKNPPRLFLTWTKNESRLTGAVKVQFSR